MLPALAVGAALLAESGPIDARRQRRPPYSSARVPNTPPASAPYGPRREQGLHHRRRVLLAAVPVPRRQRHCASRRALHQSRCRIASRTGPRDCAAPRSSGSCRHWRSPPSAAGARSRPARRRAPGAPRRGVRARRGESGRESPSRRPDLQDPSAARSPVRPVHRAGDAARSAHHPPAWTVWGMQAMGSPRWASRGLAG